MKEFNHLTGKYETTESFYDKLDSQDRELLKHGPGQFIPSPRPGSDRYRGHVRRYNELQKIADMENKRELREKINPRMPNLSNKDFDLNKRKSFLL